ncbi:MAG: PAS domain S-box protein [Pseudomonadota bacterium]
MAKGIASSLTHYAEDVTAIFALMTDNAIAGNQIGGLEPFASNLDFKSICVVDPKTGAVTEFFAGTKSACPSSLSIEEIALYIKEAGNDRSGFSPVRLGKDGPEILLSRFASGKLVVATIGTGYFLKVAEDVSFGERGHATIVDRNGKVLAHPVKAWHQEVRDLSALEPVRQIAQRRNGVTNFYSPALQEEMISAHAPVPATGWGVLIPQPMEELVARAESVDRFIFNTIAIGFFVAAILGWVLSGYLTRPVLAVRAAALKMATGDLSSRVEKMSAITPRELRDLGKSFDLMAESIRIDVAHRKSAENALRASEEKFRRVFEHGSLGMTILGPDLRFLMANNRACEVLGYGAREMAGLSLSDILSADDVAQFAELSDKIAADDETISQFETRLIRNDRSLFSAHITASVIKDKDWKASLGLLMIEDITEREALNEKLRYAQKMEAIGQLTGGVAHDFNNLLAVILGHTEILEERAGKLPEPLGRSLSAIRRAANRGAILTERLMIFSRRRKPDAAEIEVNHHTYEIFQSLKPLLGEAIHLSYQVCDEPCWVRVDLTQLGEVLLTLALNAKQAMPEGGQLKVSVSTLNLSERSRASQFGLSMGDYAVIAVSDTGMGMDDRVLEHATEPFFTTKNVGEGSGLGLSMAYGFAIQSGGVLRLSSRPEQGAEVALFLPLLIDHTDGEAVGLEEHVFHDHKAKSA